MNDIKEKTKSIENLPPKISSTIKMKIDEFGRNYTEDSHGNIIDGMLFFKNGKIIATKEFLAFFVYKTGIRDMIKRFLKTELKDEIIKEDETYRYIIFGKKNIPLISIIFKFINETGFWKKKYVLEINTIITPDELKYEQIEAIKSVIYSSRHILLKDPIIKETKCIIKINTNI